ncbi:uncharacterized protein [Panulirus ornatus]|uniref:uncharacterized protein n=1 Tax=Panulirus ornatus TaxID=150431 RepID=UPI003A8A4CF1
MQIGHVNGNASDSAPRSKVRVEPGDRVYYTTAPRVKGIKFMLHEYLRSQSKGHLVRTLKPGEPRRIIVKALSDFPRTPYVKQNRRKPEGGGVPEVSDCTTVFTKTPSAGASLPVDAVVSSAGTSFPGDGLVSTAGTSFPGGDLVPSAGTSFPGGNVVPSAGTSFPGGNVVPPAGMSFPGENVVPSAGTSFPGGNAVPSAGTSFPVGNVVPSAGTAFPGGNVIPSTVTSFPGGNLLPSAGTSFPGGNVLPSAGTPFPGHDVITYVKNILGEPVSHAAPVSTAPVFRKKKRKRKRKRKVKEPLPILHESKDQKGKNKSTKHIPPPAITLSDSSENDEPSASHLTPSCKPHEPSNDHRSIAETTMGSLTQAIFRGKSNQRVEESRPCIELSSSSEDFDISILPTPSPMASYPQNNLSRAADLEKKRSATQAHEEVISKSIKKSDRDESLIILKEGSCPPRKQYEEVQVGELENHMKKSSDGSGTPFSKIADKPLETRTAPPQLYEISSCTEADVSSLLKDPSKMNQRKRKGKVSKFSLSQRTRRDSSDESEANFESPTTSKFKHKCASPQKSRLNLDLLNNISKNICDQESQKINHEESHEDDMGWENRLPSCSLSCHGSSVHGISENISAADSVRNQKKKVEPDYTSVQKKAKMPTSCRMSSELSTVDNGIAFEREKKRVCCITSVPETSESSVFSSNSSMITEIGALGNGGIEKTATVCNKVSTEQRGTMENSQVSGSVLIENDFNCNINQRETAKGENDAPSSNPSVSSNASSISSASTEMLHPVGKTCLQNVVFILRDHYGGTPSEIFEVLRKNSFNLLTTIQELHVLYPPYVEVAHCSEVEEESSGG